MAALSSSASRPRFPGPPNGSSSFSRPSLSQQQQQPLLYPQLPSPPSQQQQQQQQAPSQQASLSASAAALPSKEEDPVYDPLERAGKIVGEQLSRDSSLIGELGEGLQGTSSGAYTLPPSPNFAPFVKKQTYTIPDGLFAEYEALTHKCFMGIFPEIDRAWMTIDNKLFLWDFKESADFSRYDEQSEIIVHVGLVPAKPGVFIPEITHLLVLCTPTTLHLLGLSRSAGDITLYATDLSIATDGISMTDVVAMPSGRAFMAGSDGCLYEMQYRADEGWFTKRCGLVNWTGPGGGLLGGLVPEFLKGKTEDPIIHLTLDATRSVIYALTSSDAIELYLIDGEAGLTKVARASELHRTALMLAPGAQTQLDARGFVIRSVSAITRGEGESGAQMVAVTGRGVRLYFSYHRRGYGGIRTTGGPPTALELVHVRLPPTNLTIGAPQQQFASPAGANGGGGYGQQQVSPPIKFNSLTAAAGVFGGILVGPQPTAADNVEILLLTTPDLGRLSQPPSPPQQQQQTLSSSSSYYGSSAISTPVAAIRPALTEQAYALPIDGRTWAIAEVPHPLSGAMAAPPALRVPGRGELKLNELAAQTGSAQRMLLVLSSEGMHVIAKQRPVDVLKAVLDSGASGREGEIKAFFDNYGRDQACAMCLALASAPEPSSAMGDSNHLSSAIPGPVSPDAVAGAKRLFYEFGGQPVKVDRGFGVSGQSSTQIFYSGRREGLAIYFARLLRPVWREKLTSLFPVPGNPNQQVSNVSDQTLVSVQRDLMCLKTFIEQNGALFASGPPTEYPSDRASNIEAWKAEHASLAAIVALVTQAIEAISFVLLLVDYKLPETVANCTVEIQRALLGLTYQDLLTTKAGRDVARSIVNAVIYQQISQQISIDTISEILQQRCGSFCRADDVILFKAIEGMRKAKETRDPIERRESLRESLRLFGKGTSNLSLAKLQETCAEYRSLHFPTGAIELPLKCAQDWDPSAQGLGYWNDGEISGDPRKASYERRRECYECVFETLLAFDKMLDDEFSGRGARAANGSGEEIETLRANAYNQALSSEDPLFHASLYDWLVSRRMTDQLLEIRTPFIERYLSREPITEERSELLWQYHVRNGHYGAAAIVQANLAQSLETDLPLDRRLEYLTLAVANAKSSGSSRVSSSVEFLTDLEEKLDVAQVQIEVFRTIYEHTDMDEALKAALMAKLNERLLTISELYLDFAEPFQLLEVILLILHTSDHRDPALVSKTWESIIESTAEHAGGDALTAISGVVSSLGRRFYPSETAFPLEFLGRLLEEYAYAHRTTAVPGWVPNMLRAAGVEWERIFDVFYVIFEEKMYPWQSEEAVTFLASDIVSLLGDWYADWTRSQTSYDKRSSSAGARFPYLQIEEFITSSLMPCFPSIDDRRAMQLKELVSVMRRSA